ncbi:MAG: hypothetical protein FIA97_08455 [Methylococcaceae bacterium]|nr:hypothetical protein [Methylococcaceae bacterium]
MNRSAYPLRMMIFGLAVAVLTSLWTADGQAAARKKGSHPVSAQTGKPQRVASIRQLRKLLGGKQVHASAAGLESLARSASPDSSGKGAGAAADVAGYAHSSTNVQVQGVDEADLVKTDGDYLYSVQGGRVRIVRAYPAKDMALLASIELDGGLSPSELYLEGNRLVVIATGWNSPQPAEPQADVKMGFWWPVGEPKTIARVYDVSDRAKPALEREVSFSGSYLTSRMIGDSVYLLGRTYPSLYLAAARASEAAKPAKATRQTALPSVSDSAVGGGKDKPLSLSRVYYFPDFVEPDYVIIAGFRLSQPAAPADIKSFLGAGDVAYASTGSIYLSAADYGVANADGTAPTPASRIYKFDIDQGQSRFRIAGEVPGTVLNQFSMDESGGYFRIATTVSQWVQKGETGELQSWNNLYTLNGDLKIAGRLEHLADGERIYSARFLGDRCYLVTFRQVDPLYVVDLSNADAPKVAGELKIPGFSNYLHPYDARHILGFGQDVGEDGQSLGGVKLALFDVSDLSKPTLRHSLVIGSQGSYSDLFYDHKALLFDQDRNLIGFPILETAAQSGADWPVPVFQGAQVYRITPEDGFKKLAAISHATEDGYGYYDWNRTVRRLLTIEDQLYTISEARIQANDLGQFAQTGAVDMPDLPIIEPPVIDPPVIDPVIDPIVEPTPPQGDQSGGVACTQDARLCPDGTTWVSRIGPSCEFAACPGGDAIR